MGRPSKPLDLMSKNLTKEEIQARREQEQKLKGNTDNIMSPNYLSDEIKEVFDWLVDELSSADILCNLDVPLLEETAKAIYYIRYVDDMIIKNPNNLFEKQVMTTREKYLKSLQRAWNELGMSPQSRAKLGNINIQKQQKESDPLLNALKVIK